MMSELIERYKEWDIVWCEYKGQYFYVAQRADGIKVYGLYNAVLTSMAGVASIGRLTLAELKQAIDRLDDDGSKSAASLRIDEQMRNKR